MNHDVVEPMKKMNFPHLVYFFPSRSTPILRNPGRLIAALLYSFILLEIDIWCMRVE